MKEPKDYYKEYYNEQWHPKDEADKFKKQFDYFDLLDFARSYAEAINYTHCCETLKDEEETAFDLWLKNFKHAERDLYWYNENTLYCIEAMRDIYNTEVKPKL